MGGEQKAHPLSRLDRELGGLLQVVAADGHVAPQLEGVGSGDGAHARSTRFTQGLTRL
jgi:hypothetical protein